MSEKLKPNFTPVPNVILDEIMRGLNEGEFKTLMAICRYTYGWGKQSDQISLNQLADITGMNRSNVARARKRLGNLVEVTPGTATMASTYRLNIEISNAELKAASVKGSAPSATSDHSATSVKGSDPSATFQRNPKKEDSGANAPSVCASSNGAHTGGDRVSGATQPNSVVKRSKKSKPARQPDPVQAAAFARFYEAYPRRVGKKPALAAWLRINPGPALLKTIMEALGQYREQVKDTEERYVLHPATWLNQERWEDESLESQAVKEPKFVND